MAFPWFSWDACSASMYDVCLLKDYSAALDSLLVDSLRVNSETMLVFQWTVPTRLTFHTSTKVTDLSVKSS